MAFARGRNVSYTVLLGPRIGRRTIGPYIVEPLGAIGATEAAYKSVCRPLMERSTRILTGITGHCS
jgi:hypothetical protein